MIECTFQEQAPLLPEFIRKFRPPFPVGSAHRDGIYNYYQHSMMLRFMVPKIVFIDRKGMIRAQVSGEDSFFVDEEKSIRMTLDGMLKDSPAAEARKKTAAAK